MDLQRLQTRSMIIAVILGLMGVFSGYALFVLLREQLQEGKGAAFLLAVLVAGMMSFAIEWVRDVIRHGHEEPLKLSRVVVTIFTLMMFEIFVIALHDIPSWHLADVSKLPHELLGTAADAGKHPLTNLLLLTGIWFLAGAVLSATLTWSIFRSHERSESHESFGQQVMRSATRGIGGGAIAAPIAAIVAVLALRVFIIAHLYFFAHADWRDSMKGIVSGDVSSWGNNIFTAGARLSLIGFLWLDSLWGGFWIGPLLTVVAYVVVLTALIDMKAHGGLIAVVVLAGLVTFFQPLGHDLKAMFAIPLLAALVWAIPGLVLGALNPLLRQPSKLPREWGILACVAAGVLLIATWSRFEFWWIFPVVLLVVAIIYFRQGISVEEYWPFVALSVAIIVAGATSLMQFVSFAGVLQQLHEINSLPAYIIDQPKPIDIQLWKLNPTKNLFKPTFTSSPLMDQAQLDKLLKPKYSLLRFAKENPNLFPDLAPTTRPLQFSDYLQPNHPNLGFERYLQNDTGLNGQPIDATQMTIDAFSRATTQPAAAAADIAEAAPAEHREATTAATTQESDLNTSGKDMDPEKTARLLEICLSAAFAFWCTVSMLATWAMVRSAEHPGHAEPSE